MATAAPGPKLLVIIGPTASGKSALAIKIAKEFNGEIIAADSRTVYRGMDVGTAKPTPQERQEVPHWGLDLIEPGQSYSAGKFKRYAEAKIKDIQKRGKLPILVGGTGLYADSIVLDFELGPPADSTRRRELEQLDIQQLQELITRNNYPMPENKRNKRHLIRTLEREGRVSKKTGLLPGTLIIGLDPGPETLKKRIGERVEQMFAAGFLDEVKKLVEKYGTDAILKTGGIGYDPAVDCLNGKLSKEEAKKLFKQGDWQYARRQRTWFKRHDFIRWFEDSETAFTEVKNY